MKTKIQIKSRVGSLLFEHECSTIAEAVIEAIAKKINLSYANLSSANLSSANLSSANLRSADLSSADLSYANLSYANLRSANLSSANLSYANLRSANLSSADLSYANLSYANLSSANLSYAKTDKRYIQISCIGSSKRLTTYCFEDNIVLCGCFKGSLEQFEIQVNETHKEKERYLKEYLGFISYIKSLKSN